MPIFSKTPLMYHPTNVLLLDDDRKFLNDINFTIDETVPVLLDTDPNKVLAYLASHTFQSDTLSERVSKQSFETDASIGLTAVETFEVIFAHLWDPLDLPDRYKMVLIIFVDKMMPSMDGLEFCRRVREAGFPVALILFTGQADAAEAVTAFNDGLIDAYLRKDDPKLNDKVNNMIKRYSLEKFIELSDKLSGFISHVMAPLNDEQFCNVFEKVRREHQIIEFYVVDSSCSFLMLNDDGEVSIFFVRNENDFNDAYEIAKNSEASYDVLQALRGRQQFPYTKKNMGYVELQGDRWDDVMISMDKVPGRELYYAVAKQPAIKVLSFKKYRGEIWPEP